MEKKKLENNLKEREREILPVYQKVPLLYTVFL